EAQQGRPPPPANKSCSEHASPVCLVCLTRNCFVATLRGGEEHEVRGHHPEHQFLLLVDPNLPPGGPAAFLRGAVAAPSPSPAFCARSQTVYRASMVSASDSKQLGSGGRGKT